MAPGGAEDKGMTNELIAIFGMGITILGSIALAWKDLHRDLTGLSSRVSSLEQRMARIEGWLEGWRAPHPGATDQPPS